MPIEIECPSGLTGKVRGLTGRDGRFLTDQRLVKTGGLIDKILTSCWVETVDPGIYKSDTREDGSLNWGKVLQGDRYFTLMQIRNAGSESSDFSFPVQCKGCRERFEWEIDLDDLTVKQLPEESRKAFAAGERTFECVIPGTEETRRIAPSEEAIVQAKEDGLSKPKVTYEIVPGTGTSIKFTLPDGNLETRAFKLNKQKKRKKKEERESENPLIDALLLRIKDIDEVDPGKNRRGWLEYLEGLSLADLRKLISRFDEQDCGIDTVVEIQCPDCGEIQEVELPFDETFFFGGRRR